MVDGLELYKAIHHAKGHKESHNHALPEESPPPGVPSIQFDTSIDDLIEGRDDFGAVGNEIYCTFPTFMTSSNFIIIAYVFISTYFLHIFTAFVDQLLANYDIDDDGRLSFVEFFDSYEEAKDKLKIS